MTQNWEEWAWLSIRTMLCPESILRHLLVTVPIVSLWVLLVVTNTSEEPAASKALVITYQTTRCHNAEDNRLNLKPQSFYMPLLCSVLLSVLRRWLVHYALNAQGTTILMQI
jgi:hypothetical protein